MSKGYLCQLSGGKMLVFQDGWVGVEAVGYPLPDCVIKVGGTTYRGQTAVLKAVLGYAVEDIVSFTKEVSGFSPMKFADFKRRVITNDIGGGCQARLKKAMSDDSLGFNQALFKYILPDEMIDQDCLMPSETEVDEEYSDLLAINWAVHHNEPNWRFRNNILMFSGCGEVTDRLLSFIEDLESICLAGSERAKYRYLSGITLSNGRGAILMLDSYAGNCDVSYLYWRVTGCDLSEGQIITSCDEAGAVTAHYEVGGRKSKLPELNGVVVRKLLN